MEYCFSIDWEGYKYFWEVYKVEEAAPDLEITTEYFEEGINNLLKKIKDEGLKVRIGMCHFGNHLFIFGKKREMKRIVDIYSMRTHGGPSYEAISTEELNYFIKSCRNGNSHEFSVFEVPWDLEKDMSLPIKL